MKKVLSVFMCCVLMACLCLPQAFALTTIEATKEIVESTTIEQTTQQETTEFVLSVDVNKRYTDISEAPDGEDNGKSEGSKTLYIALLCAALVVAVVILAVTLKRVPKEEDIDISGASTSKKGKKE